MIRIYKVLGHSHGESKRVTKPYGMFWSIDFSFTQKLNYPLLKIKFMFSLLNLQSFFTLF